MDSTIPGQHPPTPGQHHPPPTPHPGQGHHPRSTSGRYASYWNALFMNLQLSQEVIDILKSKIRKFLF